MSGKPKPSARTASAAKERGALAVKKPAKLDVAPIDVSIIAIEALTLERVALYAALRDLLAFWDRRDLGQWTPREMIRLGEIRELATPAKGDSEHATTETKGKPTGGGESGHEPDPHIPGAAPGV